MLGTRNPGHRAATGHAEDQGQPPVIQKVQRIGPGSCHWCQVLNFFSNLWLQYFSKSRCSRCSGCSQLSEAHSNYRITNQIIPFFRLKRTSMWLTWKAMFRNSQVAQGKKSHHKDIPLLPAVHWRSRPRWPKGRNMSRCPEMQILTK